MCIRDSIDLLHTGALLKGSFSRYEYARESKSGQASIQSFDTVLPAAASDIYYRDEIGNISTSHTRVKKDSVELTLRPRFPLFGGWKTRYTIGYNVPSYEKREIPETRVIGEGLGIHRKKCFLSLITRDCPFARRSG
ncbi:Dolichyl-diphosphooligosaccharide--protein glycosyltransferase subunit 1 [Temnothorax longispinosus]|uniref:Dolichyl-diphosphooligosaccharide--protein glycosyltransferase subunit 1 n=1 Tax=Temnothorax longispinosus TaxID=300112 RepID=A0A4S2L185_9HYME|nr:Dolichyl-diphosphooligosaccharide--protein glycosyltransferase subunit 1 [Temnothorax longispinosus]